ncbi:MAG: lysophospholipid acyltransferase family protein [Bacillota bacterium]
MLRFVFNVLTKLPSGIRKPLTKGLIYTLTDIYTTTRVTGLESIPNGPVVFVGNHLSNSDGLFLSRALRVKQPVFLAGVKLQDTAMTRVAAELIDTIPIVPNSPDRDAIKRAIDTLKSGRSIFIFPEGGRSRSGGLIHGKAGAILIAKKAGVPIVPVGLQGSDDFLPINDTDMGGEKPQRGAKIEVRIGKPFRLPELLPNWDEASREEQIDALMLRIADLLDPRYRGVYANGMPPREPEQKDE